VTATVLISNVNVLAVPAGTSTVTESIEGDSFLVIVAISGPVTIRTIEVTGAAGCFIVIEKTAAASLLDPERPKKHPEIIHAASTRTIERWIRSFIYIILS